MQADRKNQIQTEKLSLNRRTLARWALGGSAALALSACGGGGGGDDSDGQVDLYAIYDQIVPGMSREDVANLIGEPPNDRRTIDFQIWRYGNQMLSIMTFGDEHWLVSEVIVDSFGGSLPRLVKTFPLPDRD